MLASWPSYATGVGRVSLRPFALDDAEKLHRWVTSEHARYWGMLQASVDDVRVEYARMLTDDAVTVCWGSVEGRAAFLIEYYDPARSPLAGKVEIVDGDLGLHVLVSPPAVTRPGFTSDVFAVAMHTAFDVVQARRVLVEPDERNCKIRAKNVDAGFVEHGPLPLPDKVAMFSTAVAPDFYASPIGTRPCQRKDLS